MDTVRNNLRMRPVRQLRIDPHPVPRRPVQTRSPSPSYIVAADRSSERSHPPGSGTLQSARTTAHRESHSASLERHRPRSAPSPLLHGIRPVAFAAASDRSMIRPCTNGPRSVIRTTTLWLFVRFVTRTSVPIGSVRCAAVIAFWSYTAPSAPLRPAYGGPYQLAIPTSVEMGLPRTLSGTGSGFVTPAEAGGTPALFLHSRSKHALWPEAQGDYNSVASSYGSLQPVASEPSPRPQQRSAEAHHRCSVSRKYSSRGSSTAIETPLHL